MPALLRCPGSAGARPCPGRSSLDRACAPAEYGSYREARTGKISQFEVSNVPVPWPSCGLRLCQAASTLAVKSRRAFASSSGASMAA